MANTALVTPELTAGLIEGGERLLERLDAANIPVTAAFWHLSGDDTGWRLIVASPEVSQTGKLRFYGKTNAQLRTLGDTELSVSHVTAVRPDDPIVSLLRRDIKTGQGISRIRLTGNVINGTLIPDALIYRLL